MSYYGDDHDRPGWVDDDFRCPSCERMTGDGSYCGDCEKRMDAAREAGRKARIAAYQQMMIDAIKAQVK